jgi:hypothetical protein
MATVEQDRALIKTLNFDPAELALLCVRFQDEGVPFSAPCFLSLSEEAVHRDSRGIYWRVDTKALAQKLTAAGLDERRALTRAIFRFWEQYPAVPPAAAMRIAGLN